MSSDEDCNDLKIKEVGSLMDKSPRSKRAAATDKPDAALLSDDDSSADNAEDLVLGYRDSYQPSGDVLESTPYDDGDALSSSDHEIAGFTADRHSYALSQSNPDELRETSLVDMPLNAVDSVSAQPIASNIEISKIATALKDTVQIEDRGKRPGRPVRVTGKKKSGRRKAKNEAHPKPLIQLEDGKHFPSDSELDHTDNHGHSRLVDHDDLEWDDQFTMMKRKGTRQPESDSDSSEDYDEGMIHSAPSPRPVTVDDDAVLPGQGLDIEELFVAPVRGKPLIQLDYDTDCELATKQQQKSGSSRVKTRHKIYLDDPDIHQVIMELASALHRYVEDVRTGVYQRRKNEAMRQRQQEAHMQSMPNVSITHHNGSIETNSIRNATSLNHVGPYNGHGKPGRNIVSRILQEESSSSTEDDDRYTNQVVQRQGQSPLNKRDRLGPELYQRCPDCGERHPPDNDDDEFASRDVEICPDCGVAHNPYQHQPSARDHDDERNDDDSRPSIDGPHRREELVIGALYKMKYLGSSQVITHHPVTKETRMQQAQEAYSRIKVPEGEQQPITNVDLVISTERIKVINADDKQRDVLMDHALRTVCFICDMGNILVLMARRLTSDQATDINLERNFSASLTSLVAEREKKTSKSMCHVFECEQAQMVAQAIGQAFNIAYEDFLNTNGIRHDNVEEAEYCHVLESQKIVGKDLPLLTDTNNAKDVVVQKKRGEALGIMLIESGWGSMLPTVFVAHLANYAPAARLAGQLAVGDHILACNGASLVGLPLAECNQILKNTRSSTRVILNVVSCPPVVEVLIVRPDTKYQLGFSVKNGTICSLLRGGIAERGGVRVGHRIIEVNGESMVAKAHQHIVDVLANTTGEIQMKTMPVAMYRLMVGLDLPQHV